MKEESELKKDNTQTHTCCPKCGCVHVGDCKFQLKENEWLPINQKQLPSDRLICEWKHPEYGVITGSLIWDGGKLESEKSWWVFPVGGAEADISLDEFTHYRKIYKPVPDRPTPLVETKTAEEITLEQLLVRAARYGYEYHETTKFPEMLFDENCKNNFLQFIQSNAAYKTLSAFTASAKSVEVEEANPTAQDQAIINVDNMPNIHKQLPEKAYIFGFIDGSNWQEQKQADTIIRLRKALENIVKHCKIISPAIPTTVERIAKEGLEEKES